MFPTVVQGTLNLSTQNEGLRQSTCLVIQEHLQRELTLRCLVSRGNSKYHYYGIRLKPDSPLNRLQEDTQYMAMRQQPMHQKPRWVTWPKASLRTDCPAQDKGRV